MTSVMCPSREGERGMVGGRRREVAWQGRKVKVGEGGRKLFPHPASRGPIVGSPAGAFSPRLQLIGRPTTWPPGGCGE